MTRPVDVRLNPISRKTKLSRTALARALADAGIADAHRRELGNPKTNRVGFAGSPPSRPKPEPDTAKSCTSRSRRRNQQPRRGGLAERVAVLCFEVDQSRCPATSSFLKHRNA